MNKLPEWFPIYSSCGKCSEHGFLLVEGVATKCPCRKDYEYKAHVASGLLESNVITLESSLPYVNEMLQISFESYKGPDRNKNVDKLKKFVDKFEEKYSNLNLFFSGIPGTQKSTLSKILIKGLVNKNIKCYYILANTLIEKIIDSSRKEETKEELENIINVDFLVIDEFDEDKIITYASGWQRKNLFPWIKRRLELIKKSTLFISNKPINKIGDYFEEAIQDLILREVKDKTMVFEDKYYAYSEDIDLDSIWN